MAHFEIVRDDARKHPDASIRLPERGTAHSVACDFFAPEDVTIFPGESAMIWTDVKAIFEPNEALLLNVRSSMGKAHIIPANAQGWVESDYANNPGNDGNIGFRLLNLGHEAYSIKAGDRIGQGMLVNYIPIGESTDRIRIGGFGSTGK